MKSTLGLALILLYAAGCVPPGAVGVESGKEKPQGVVQQATSTQRGLEKSSPQKVDRLLGLQVVDHPGETVISLNGNGSFQDYQFRRAEANGFVLDLPDIDPAAEKPVLPASSDEVRLSYAEGKSPLGTQLTGTLRTPLDHYALSSVGNDLILTLYLARSSAPNPLDNPSSPADPKPAPSKKSKSKGAPAAPAPKNESPQAAQVAEGSALNAEVQATVPSLKTKYTGKPISLDLMDADLRNVLRLLADITGTNIVIEPDVTGKVTLKVEQVPWDQVLDMVLAMNELGKQQNGNVIRIAKQTRLRDEFNSQAEQLKAKQALLEVAKDMGEISTAYLTVNYAQPADIAAKINEIKSDKGKISVDQRTSLILYSDYPARIESARQLLARLDKATSQVLIEARIVTVTESFTRNLGVEWGLNFSHVNATNSLTPFTQDFQVNSPPANLFGFTMAQVFGKTLAEVDLRLSALQTANEVKIMAAPRVLTIDNVKAVITQGTQIPYRTFNEYGTVTGTEFKDAVLELQVTPHITPDRKVRLVLDARQDEPSTTVIIQGEPGIDTRKVTTELLVDDASIVVIGGVIRNREESSREDTPGLGRIPILGRLFTDTDNTASSKTEMLIFISPKIVETSGEAHRG